MATSVLLLNSKRLKIVKWTLTTADATGDPYALAGYFPEKSFHAFGTWGGGTVTMKGSNEIAVVPTSMIALGDMFGGAAALAATDGIKTILENTFQIAPYLTGSTGATVTVLLFITLPPGG